MKKFVLSLVVLLVVLSINGCGSSNPEDVAVNFIKSLSELNFKEAKKLSNLDNKFNRFERTCLKQKIKELWIITNNLTMDAELSNQINIKYPNGTKELSLMEKEEFLEEFANILDRRLSDNINPTADIVIIKKVLVTGLSGLIINRERPLYNDIMQNLVLKNASMMILECLSESVLFTNISNISVEKIINESSEKVAVRLKITLNDTKSEEILLKLEKIQNNWKVVNPTSFN